MSVRARLLWWLLGLPLIFACTLAPGRPPFPALHDFGPAVEIESQRPVNLTAVEIDAPEWLDNDRIRYRLLYASPTRVRFYSRDRWVAPLPALLRERLSAALSGHGYRVRIRLMDFEQVFESRERAKVVLRFRATAHVKGKKQPAAEQVFQLSHDTPSADAAGAVKTFAELVEIAIDRLRSWLSESSERVNKVHPLNCWQTGAYDLHQSQIIDRHG